MSFTLTSIFRLWSVFKYFCYKVLVLLCLITLVDLRCLLCFYWILLLLLIVFVLKIIIVNICFETYKTNKVYFWQMCVSWGLMVKWSVCTWHKYLNEPSNSSEQTSDGTEQHRPSRLQYVLLSQESKCESSHEHALKSDVADHSVIFMLHLTSHKCYYNTA